MTRARPLPLARFARDDSGATMVEFAIVVTVFLLVFFAIIDFAIFASNNLLAEKATQVAARIAVTRPAACTGVPDRITVGTASPAPRFGTSCRAVANSCATVTEVSCTGVSTNATANEIWTRIGATLPSGTQISSLRFVYTQDAALGYLGGPYVPRVTVELTLPAFQFITPIPALANLASGDNTTTIGTPRYRVISITLPGEDLALGTSG